MWDARDKDRVVTPFVRPLREELARDFRVQARAVFGAVALLLVVACANVASVMLACALARRREMGIRLALGASRLRIARQLFVENLLLATAGGALGLLLGTWALRALIAAAGDQLPSWATFAFDWRAAAFTALLTLLTTLLLGWAPALHVSRGDLRGALGATGGATTYAVTSYLVSQRTRELGIRIALCARRGDIVRTVLQRSLAVASAGIVAGVVVSFSLTRVLADLLFGVSPRDAGVLGATTVILIALALVSNLLPARRAASTDPMRSLRAE